MDKELAIQKLKQCQQCPDAEAAHINADQVLCDLLLELGYADVVLEWDNVLKYYI